jgi:hypothetical protein
MDKRSLTETDIRSKFITPALTGADGDKWNLLNQIREEVFFTNGRVIVRGKTVCRGEAKKADYILYFKPNLPLAVIEAKDNTHAVGAGMQQALAGKQPGRWMGSFYMRPRRISRSNSGTRSGPAKEARGTATSPWPKPAGIAHWPSSCGRTRSRAFAS